MKDIDRGRAWLRKQFEKGGSKYGPMPAGATKGDPETSNDWVIEAEEVEAIGALLRENAKMKDLLEDVPVIIRREKGKVTK